MIFLAFKSRLLKNHFWPSGKMICQKSHTHMSTHFDQSSKQKDRHHFPTYIADKTYRRKNARNIEAEKAYHNHIIAKWCLLHKHAFDDVRTIWIGGGSFSSYCRNVFLFLFSHPFDRKTRAIKSWSDKNLSFRCDVRQNSIYFSHQIVHLAFK